MLRCDNEQYNNNIEQSEHSFTLFGAFFIQITVCYIVM